MLLLTTGLWTMLYAVFSFGFVMDPETCQVSNKDDLIPVHFPLVDSESVNDPHQVDVAERFKFFFDTAFMLSCGQLIIGTLGLCI